MREPSPCRRCPTGHRPARQCTRHVRAADRHGRRNSLSVPSRRRTRGRGSRELPPRTSDCSARSPDNRRGDPRAHQHERLRRPAVEVHLTTLEKRHRPVTVSERAEQLRCGWLDSSDPPPLRERADPDPTRPAPVNPQAKVKECIDDRLSSGAARQDVMPAFCRGIKCAVDHFSLTAPSDPRFPAGGDRDGIRRRRERRRDDRTRPAMGRWGRRTRHRDRPGGRHWGVG